MNIRKDLIFAAAVTVFFLPFIISDVVFRGYYQFNQEHGLLMSFMKFAILATLGEVIGLRIKTGNYYQKGFGILPRSIVWGFLGMSIFMAFAIFSAGTPRLLVNLGLSEAESMLQQGLSWKKVLVSFSISTALNLFYAPVLMTFHKITDIHIVEKGGTVKGLFSHLDIALIFKKINWDIQWNFILKRTIPLFWIPAQTITFLLPEEYRVLFAAFLGIVLGVLLALAGLKNRENG